MVFQYAFIILFNGVVGAATPLPRSPIKVGPFAANTCENALTLCRQERDLLLNSKEFPHMRLVVDCFPADPK